MSSIEFDNKDSLKVVDMVDFKRLALAGVATSVMAMAMAMAGSAYAQAGGDYFARDKYEAVTDRYQPEYDPEPIRLGAFLVNSQFNAGLDYTSNVFGSNNNEESDVIARVGADVRARTNWSVHEISADISASRDEFQDFDQQSATNVRANLAGRLDVTRQFSLGGNVYHEQRTDQRFDPSNAAGLGSPIEYTVDGVGLQANYTNGRIRWRNSANFSETDFDDAVTPGGAPVDQDYRDRSDTVLRSRLSYAVSPNFAVFGQGVLEDYEYDQATIINGQPRSRDYSVSTISAGANFELEALVRGDIAVGYLESEKDDAFFPDVDGLAVDASMQWFPSRLTTVGFSAGRRVIDTGVLDSPSAIYTNYGVRVDHELRRNIIVSGYANFSDYEFEEIDRKDDVLDLRASVTYKINKRVHTNAYIGRVTRDRSGAGLTGDQSLEANLIGIGVSIYP